MKRRLLKLALLLNVGAILNVAVAWFSYEGSGFLLSYKPGAPPKWLDTTNVESHRILKNDSSDLNLALRFGAQALSQRQLRVIEEGFAPGFRCRVVAPTVVAAYTGPSLSICETGRPWLALQDCAALLPDGTRRFMWTFGADELPLRPIWPGFAINTAFYTAIVWVLFIAPFKVRRLRRIKHGLCPTCAYPVGTNPRCTECGKPVTHFEESE